MLNSSLIEALRTFTKNEIIRFDEMIRSPYFNKSSTVTKFWSVLKKFSPQFDNEDLEREIIYKKVFPERKYNYGTMKNLVYDLSKLTEKFFEMNQLEKNDYWKSYFHLSELLEKGLDKQFGTKFALAEAYEIT